MAGTLPITAKTASYKMARPLFSLGVDHIPSGVVRVTYWRLVALVVIIIKPAVSPLQDLDPILVSCSGGEGESRRTPPLDTLSSTRDAHQVRHSATSRGEEGP